MDIEHTPEPWRVEPITEDNAEDNGGSLIESRTGRMICECFEDGEAYTDVDRANARRIVACVNACAGISTEMLERRGPNIWIEAIRALERAA